MALQIELQLILLVLLPYNLGGWIYINFRFFCSITLFIIQFKKQAILNVFLSLAQLTVTLNYLQVLCIFTTFINGSLCKCPPPQFVFASNGCFWFLLLLGTAGKHLSDCWNQTAHLKCCIWRVCYTFSNCPCLPGTALVNISSCFVLIFIFGGNFV